MQVLESDIPLQEPKRSSLLHTDSIQTDSREICGVIKPSADVTISIPEWDSKDDTPYNSK